MYNTLEELDTALTHNWTITIDNHKGTRFQRSNTSLWKSRLDNQWIMAQLINGQMSNHKRFDELQDALKYYPALEGVSSND